MQLATESKRSSNDSKRTRLDDRPENSKKSSTKKPALAKPDHLALSTRCPLVQLASVPTADKLDISKQTRSMTPPVSPPLYPSFDWWSAASHKEGQAVPTKKQTRRKGVLHRLMKSSNREAREREKRRQIEERATARKVRKEENMAEKLKVQREREQKKIEDARLREEARRQEDQAREEKKRRQEELRAEKQRQANEQRRKAQEEREERRRLRLEREEENQRKKEEKAKARPKFNYGSCRP